MVYYLLKLGGDSYGKVTKASEHLTLEEIDEKIKSTVGFWRVKRWMVIRHALANPSTAKEIALNTGMAEQSVHNLIAAYNREGEKAVETKGKGQRQKANLTLEEEGEFLKPFFEKYARSGRPSLHDGKRQLDMLDRTGVGSVKRASSNSTATCPDSSKGWCTVVKPI